MIKHKKNLFIILTAMIMIAVIVVSCSSKIVLQGYVDADYVYVSSAACGNLLKRYVNRGDNVAAGQPLFVLDPQPELARFNQIKARAVEAKQQLTDLQKGSRTPVINNIAAQLNQDRANLDLAEKTFARYQKLNQQSVVSKLSFDQAKAQYQVSLHKVKSTEAQLAEARLGARENQIVAQAAVVEAANAELEQAQWALAQKSINATITARVFDTIYEPGEFVAAGRPVITLLPLNKIKLVFFMPAKFLKNVGIGSSVIINGKYKAKITFISPSAEFTPTVIFSKDSSDKFIYRIEAMPDMAIAAKFHPGQPIEITIAKGYAK